VINPFWEGSMFKWFMAIALVGVFVMPPVVEAAGRKGSFRVGGMNSHGKGSKYYGGFPSSSKKKK
jgi:hypothetical protein